MLPSHPIPVSVLTGFLGAGKTTLLNRLLKDPDLKDTAVVINEFGEVPIDHLLVDQSSDGVIQLSDGCVCCSVRGDLVDTLADLIDRAQTGKIERLARVVVETTGLADPVPVLQSIMGHPALVQAYRLDGVVTAVDAVNGDATLDAHVEAVRQAAVADRLVITKSDLASNGEVARSLTARLRALNPRAEIIDLGDRPVGASLFSCGLYDPATKTADVARWLGETHASDHDHDHHHNHDHAGGYHHHRHHAHDHRLKSFSLVHPAPIAFSALEMMLDLLMSLHGDKLLRLKGIVELAEDPSRPLVVHAVQRLMHPPARLAAWPDETRGVRLVIIAQDLPEDYVRKLFAMLTDTPAVDAPDRAALAENPLAIPGRWR